MTIWFTSDLHLGHSNIVLMNHRPFEGIDDMNRTLIRNINERVCPTDTLWVLGDVSCHAGSGEIKKLLEKINCQDLRLVRGNHDKLWLEKLGIFNEVCDYKQLNCDNKRVILMHYPLASWNGMHREAIHLHGHMHNSSSYNEGNILHGIRRWDVGVDANNFFPVMWNEINEKLSSVVFSGETPEYDASHHMFLA